MKKNIILGFFLTIFTVVGMKAQDNYSQPTKAKHECKDASCCGSEFAPKRGDFTAQMLFGRGAFINSGLKNYVPSSGTGSISGYAPVVNDVNSNDNNVSNMAGAEFRYYASNKFAIRFSGGAILRNSPYQVNIPTVYDTDGSTVLIPGYQHTDATEEAELQFSIGGEFLLKTKNDRLFPYVGFALPFDYARRSVFTPAEITYDSNGNIGVSVPDTGARHYEITAFSVQAVAGVDYYIAKDLFFGFDIKPLSYTYAYNVKSAAPELRNLDAENSTVSFFAQYSLKVGFKF